MFDFFISTNGVAVEFLGKQKFRFFEALPNSGLKVYRLRWALIALEFVIGVVQNTVRFVT